MQKAVRSGVTAVDTTRHDFAISVLGGPTTVIDVAGRRLVIDPTFDAPGAHGHLTKTAASAVPASALGPVDAVLISHDEHADNLDDDGRRFALAAPMIITNPGAARRLGPHARGLEPWQAVELPTADGEPALSIQAVPAVHGPADGDRDATGNVTLRSHWLCRERKGNSDGLPQRRQRVADSGR